MKSILTVLFTLLVLTAKSQTLYKYDYVETFDADWSGIWWTPAATTNYYTNAFVSSTSSAVIYGTGGGTSAYESDWYSFPNLVVDPAYDYQFKFRLGSYRFTSTATTRGVDAADYITVQLSTNGGVSYVNELRITGNANAFWNYNTAGTYTKTANGTLTTIGPAAGGDRTATGDGYSVIQLNIPAGTSQIAIDIFARANAAGEEWWMDNFELTRTGGPLPVELMYLESNTLVQGNQVKWATASEYNSSHYQLESSTDGVYWKVIDIQQAAGFSTQVLYYSYVDNTTKELTYYRLMQYDLDGAFKQYGPISALRPTTAKRVVRCTNLMGQIVDPLTFQGLMIEVYEDGSTHKIIK